MVKYAPKFSFQVFVSALAIVAITSGTASAQSGDTKNRTFNLLISRNLERSPLFIDELSEATRWIRIATLGTARFSSEVNIDEPTESAGGREVEAEETNDPLAPLWGAESVQKNIEAERGQGDAFPNEAETVATESQQPTEDRAPALVPLVTLSLEFSEPELTFEDSKDNAPSVEIAAPASESEIDVASLGLSDSIAVVSSVQNEAAEATRAIEAPNLELLGVPLPLPLPQERQAEVAVDIETTAIAVAVGSQDQTASDTILEESRIGALELAAVVETIQAIANIQTDTEVKQNQDPTGVVSLPSTDTGVPPLPLTRPGDVPRYRKVRAAVASAPSNGVEVISGSEAQRLYDSRSLGTTSRSTGVSTTRSSSLSITNSTSTFGHSVSFDELTPEQQYDILRSQNSKL